MLLLMAKTLLMVSLLQRGCLLNVTVTISCISTDIKCLCAHSERIQSVALPCLQSSCDASDTQSMFILPAKPLKPVAH